MVLQQIQKQYKKRIDKLSDEAIKDIYIRKNLYEKKRKHHKEFKPGNFIQSDDHDKIMTQLKIGDTDSTLYHFLNEFMYGVQELKKMRESDKSREEWVFDDVTKDKWSEEELLEKVRNHLKATVEGVGMPRSEIVKDGIDSYAELELEA